MKVQKTKIAIVNVLFPPKAMGGATRVVVDQVDSIDSMYGDEFETVIFTADIERKPDYTLAVYPYKNSRVYSVSCTASLFSNWNAKDENVAEIFSEFLDFEKPDLIHFHCVQILTASILEVARTKNIPYYVTVHDAWWISDYQFLQDQAGRIYPKGHPDPFDKVPLPDGITLEQSLSRRAYLRNLLEDAEAVLPVSDTFRDIYFANKIEKLTTIKNGISDNVEWREKDTSYSSKLVCAHVGGFSKHKGFDLFKEAVTLARTENIEVLAVDHMKPGTYSRKEYWGKTPVTIVGHVDQKEIGHLYSKIDVLFAPSIWPESFGLVTREAAACGCWVVASDIGAIGEDVTRENGFKVKPDVESLKKTLQLLDGNFSKYKGKAPRSTTRYSSHQTAELIDLFKNKNGK